jgi:uncharacterized protein (DUF2147 family)
MKKNLNFSISAILLLLLAAPGFAQKPKQGDILGYWFNEEKTSKLQVYQEGSHLFAKIVWLKEPLDKTTGKPRTDNLNPDLKLKNAPLLGLVVLKNFVFDGQEEWKDGTIYDPKNGKTYSCYIRFDDSPNKLKIRGYIGISLLGRTTYWTRTVFNP